MIACLDVCYGDTTAIAAAVMFRDWPDAVACSERTVSVHDVQPYQPGEFFRRELPCLLQVLEGLPALAHVVIDGYVWLDDASRPGLGAHLFQALGGTTTVVGVAKTKFAGANQAREVLRGESQRPLFVTAAGVDADIAAGWLRAMHGAHRVPTLISRADRLCRNPPAV